MTQMVGVPLEILQERHYRQQQIRMEVEHYLAQQQQYIQVLHSLHLVPFCAERQGGRESLIF